MLKGVLFDMDGVLVDSEKFICEAAVRMFAEHGVTAGPGDFVPFIGAGEDRYLGGVAEKYGYPIKTAEDKARTYAIYLDLIRGRLAPLPGAAGFIGKCRKRNLKLALATSADRVKMEANLREIGLSAGVFDAAVDGLMVARKKPFSDIYLKAAGLLGLLPGECLVVEDAVNGIAAAEAAGCRSLGLMTSFSAEALSGADWIAANLEKAPDAALNW